MIGLECIRRHFSRIAGLSVLCLALSTLGCWEHDADLDVSTKAIDFGDQLDQITFSVRNAGEDGALTSGVTTLDYKIKDDQPWLTIEPASGHCGGGQKNTHVARVDRTLLTFGSNIATINVTSNAGSGTIDVLAERDVPGCTDKPSEPLNPTPADGATDVSIDADLVWNDGASRCPGLTATYDIYFGTTSPPPFDHNNGSTKTWDPGTLSNGTWYYWRIVAKDANGSFSGAEWNFKTPCATGPSTPTGPTPAHNATGVPIGQSLSWGGGNSQCSGLTSTYDVYFGTTSPPPLSHNNGNVKTWNPGTLGFKTTYYWRIVAKDANGSTSGAEWRFTTMADPCTVGPTAPASPVPAHNATDVSIDQNLSWGAGNSQCPGRTATYDIYFGTTSPPPFDHNNGSTKTWDPGTLANGTTYFWRIVAKDANGSTTGSEWTFKTPCATGPSTPTGPTPAHNATGVPIGQSLSWGGGNSQCSGLTTTYDIYFGTTSPPPFDHNNGSVKTWNPGTLAYATTYYWKIVAKDANGSTSGAEWRFTTMADPCTVGPTAPASPVPAHNATDVSIDQNLSWGAGNSQCPGRTATYDIYFGTTSPPPFDHNNGSTKTWDPGTLANGTTYYWRIVAKDANGSTTGPEWRFTTKAPCVAPPTAACTPSPGNGQTNVSENANLAWGCGISQCGGLVATYDVYFGTIPTPGAAELLGNTASKAWTLPRLQKSETYYWKIVTQDANGTTPGTIWSFTIKD